MAVRFYPTVEIAPGVDITGYPTLWSWTDITYPYVHEASKITITRGRRDRYAQTAPSTCALTLLNPAGIWVPDNPLSPYYGLIDQNTPLRVLNRPNDNNLSDGFGRTASSSWASADSGGVWTNTGTASDYSVSPANGGRHTHPSAAVRHMSRLPLSILRSDQRVRVRVNAISSGAAQTAGLVARYVDANNYTRAEMIFNVSTTTARIMSVNAGVESIVASEVTGMVHSTSAWYWLRLQTGYSSARFRIWADGTDEPRTWILDGADSVLIAAVAGTHGVHSMREAGNLNANATIDFDNYSLIDGPRTQFTGWIDQWPTTWADASESVSLAQITASGQLRRITQGSRSLKSAMFRVSTDATYSGAQNTVGYWPMEDDGSASLFASGLGAGLPMTHFDMNLAADSTILGSDPLPTGGSGATFEARVKPYAATSTWCVSWIMKIPATPSVTTGLIAWSTPGGTVVKWVMELTTGNQLILRGYNSAGTDVLGGLTSPFQDTYGASLYGRQLYMEVTAAQNGGNIDWGFTAYVDNTGSGQLGSVAGTMANPTGIWHSAFPGLVAGGYTFGHVTIRTTANTSTPTIGTTGHTGETTDSRFGRLCAEENIPAWVGEIPSSTFNVAQKMGAQRTSSLAAQLREVEATEEGILFDGKQGQLTLITRTDRQNHTVNLALDHDLGHVGWPFGGIRDDYLLRTEVTVTRSGGGRGAIATDAAAARRVGIYPDSVTVNTNDDSQLQDRAAWRLNMGSTREIRYPSVPLDFARNPGLIAAWLDMDIGSRITIAHLPAQLPPDTLDLLVEGYTETVDSTTWTATLNTSPARPWTVFRVEGGGNIGRVGSSGSTLAVAATSAASSLLVSTPTGPLWRTGSVNYDVGVAGERVTVSGVNHGIRDTFTRSTSSGWGTADSGESWVVGAGTASLFSTTGSAAQIAISSLNAEHHIAVNLGAAGHQRVRTYQTLGVTPTGAGANWGLMLRRADASNLIWIDVQIGTGGDLTLRAISKVTGTNTQLTTATSATIHSTSVARILVAEIDAGNVIRAKVYADGANEPGWELVYDASAVVGLPAGTSVGCIARLMTGNTNTAPVNFQFDNFAVLSPQSMAVTRSVNSVVKAQAAGATIKLWRAGVWSL